MNKKKKKRLSWLKIHMGYLHSYIIFKNQSIKKAIFETFSVNAGPNNGFPMKVYNTVFVPWEQAF